MSLSTSLLAVEGVSKRFGGLAALDGVSMKVESGAIAGLIGPNGSGKSTFFNVVTGIIPSDSGRILFRDQEVQSAPPDRRQRLGLARTFQEIQLFHDMTVLENVMIGAHRAGSADVFGALLRTPSVRAEEARLRATAQEWLAFVGLSHLSAERARAISYGHQRLLEIARALASGPELLMLDEPAAGMNPTETRELMAQIERIAAKGITVLLVEHNVRMVMSLCRHITVLHHGQVIASGEPAEIARNPAVIEAYLGRADI
jgi:branched-chain amino acid transport system ATP-binding protein